GGILGGLLIWIATRRTAIVASVLVVAVATTLIAARSPTIRARVRQEVAGAISRHVGHWASTGISYRIADDRFYTDVKEAPASVTADEGIRFLLRAAVAFIVVPLPRHIDSTAGFLVLPEHFLWLALVALAAGGTFVAFRRDRLLTSIFAAYCL